MKYLIFIPVLLFSVVALYSQELPDPTPQTPETASLLKFQETPVSYYTGVPNISIPIYTLQGRSLSVPISLNYHAGGIRVNEEASNEGLGWSLAASGQITRNMRGLPDERHFMTTMDKKVSDFLAINPESGLQAMIDYYNLVDDAKAGLIDFEPDSFSFSFMGYSGRFMFNQERTSAYPNGRIIMLPNSDIRIEALWNNSNEIESWIATTPDGTKYFFNAGQERLVNSLGTTVDLKGGNLNLPSASSQVNYYTSWKLGSIETHTGDRIDFEYETYTLTSCSFGSESYNGTSAAQINSTYDYESHTISSNQTTTQTSRLSKITSALGEVQFIYSNRDDMSDPDSKRLSKILVSHVNPSVSGNNQRKEILEIDLVQSYFISNTPTGNELIQANLISCGNSFNSNVETKRLKLDQVIFKGLHDTNLGGSNTPSSYSYSFEYNSTPLPHKKSYAQDFWGYYNGEDTNTAFIPTIPTQNYSGENITLNSTAIRYVNEDYSKAGVLEKIIFPEGGYQTFDMENNRAKLSNFPQNQLDFIIPPELTKQAVLNTQEDNFYSNNTTDPGSGLTVYKYKKQFEITPEILNGGAVEIDIYSTICYGSNGDIIANNQCSIVGGIRKIGQSDSYSFLLNNLSGPTLSDNITLTAGTYEIYADVFGTNFPQNGGFLEVKATWLEANPNLEFDGDDIYYVGGLRTKEIATFNDDGIAVNKKVIQYENDLTSNISLPVFAQTLNLTWGECPAEYTASVTEFNSSPVYTMVTNNGSYIGYKKVTEFVYEFDKSQNDFKPSATLVNNYEFSTRTRFSDYYGSPVDFEWMRSVPTYTNSNGNSISIDSLAFSNSLVEQSNLNYTMGVEARNLNSKTVTCQGGVFSFHKNNSLPPSQYIQEGGWTRTVQKRQISNETNGSVETVTNFEFNADIEQPTRIETIYPDGKKNVQNLYYSSSGQSIPELPTSVINDFTANNRKELIKTETFNEDNTLLNLTVNDFPSTGYQGNLLVGLIKSAKASTANLQDRIAFFGYTPYGQPNDIAKPAGDVSNIYNTPGGQYRRVLYIWGYNSTYPIAKIEGSLSYSEASARLLAVDGISFDDLSQLSDLDVDDNSEDNLYNALNSMRNALKNYQGGSMVTTYTHDPLIGVTSITDPKGYTTYFNYDEHARLKQVKDQDDNLISENLYYYKNQE